MKKLSLLFLIILFMALLLTMPEITNQGAVDGINLCLYSVIPALLPYLLITNYLISSNLYDSICTFFQPIIGRILRISKYGSFVVVLGLLCGYPMGAKLLGQLESSGKICRKESCYLITFCNNSSISFIINYIYFNCLSTQVDIKTLLLLIYLPIFFTAIINRLFVKDISYEPCINTPISANNPVLNSIKTIAMLCSYVFIFTIVAYFIKHIIPLDNIILYPLVSFIEMTSGTALLSSLNMSHIILFICSAVLWGGLSTVFQTFALIPKYLHKYYILGKFEQVLFLMIIYHVAIMF